MQLEPAKKSLIERIINVYESGRPEGNYAAISEYPDGPGGIRQVTYGRSQTTEYGNLGKLIRMYVAAKGAFAAALEPYVDRIGHQPLVDDDEFEGLLRQAGKQDPIMRSVQDRFFDEAYFQPAMVWATKHGFTRPLSALVIYDSFIHSGGISMKLRKTFTERPPASGGDESKWIRAYVEARHAWLCNHVRPVVRASSYRTKDLLREVDAGNWELAEPILANGTPVHSS